MRPIFNLSYGHVESNVSATGQSGTAAEFSFLHNGKLNAYGVGGSLMLDYERYRPENAIDVEAAVHPHLHAQFRRQLDGRAGPGRCCPKPEPVVRWRAPTGTTMFERPLRYVLEFAHTHFSSATWTAFSASTT